MAGGLDWIPHQPYIPDTSPQLATQPALTLPLTPQPEWARPLVEMFGGGGRWTLYSAAQPGHPPKLGSLGTPCKARLGLRGIRNRRTVGRSGEQGMGGIGREGSMRIATTWAQNLILGPVYRKYKIRFGSFFRNHFRKRFPEQGLFRKPFPKQFPKQVLLRKQFPNCFRNRFCFGNCF